MLMNTPRVKKTHVMVTVKMGTMVDVEEIVVMDAVGVDIVKDAASIATSAVTSRKWATSHVIDFSRWWCLCQILPSWRK